jgi:predicted ATP-binding protein involved in virulence
MDNTFITDIDIDEVRNLKQLQIPLSTTERRHLIITGRNGSGKTSLLIALKLYLNEFLKGLITATDVHGNIVSYAGKLKSNGISLQFRERERIIENFKSGRFIIAYFDSKRLTSFNEPKGINKVTLKDQYTFDERIAKEFVQYIVNLKADRSFARDENEMEEVKKVDLWFSNFEKSLGELFGDPDIQLSFDRKNYNFNIIEHGKDSYNLNQLSDGYSAILSIITELILRMDDRGVKNYNMEGIVLIDEIETHLHIDLQKKILPFLTSFFPGIQFIVTTHSPFVMSSINNTVICDLEKKIVTDDLSGYSYDTLIESYFGADKYSIVLKQKVDEYEMLMSKEKLNEVEIEKLSELKRYIKDVPKFIADELAVKIQQIQLKTLNKKK